MAKQIIVMITEQSGIDLNVQVALWYPVTSGMKPGASASQWSGASAAENSAIQAGTVIEEIKWFWFPAGIDTTTIKNTVAKHYANKNGIQNGVGPNIWFGVYDDSATGWSA